MNLECHVCAGNKIGTSFYSLDDIQAHVFRDHHHGSLDVFKFVCHKCEFKFATDYRLLRHEQTCGRETRSDEDMERIHYKLQMYELLEVTIKYNITKHQISGARPANHSNTKTRETREAPQVQCQTESLGMKRIKSEIPESLENTVSNSRQKNSQRNGSGATTGARLSVITNKSTTSTGNLRTVKTEVQDRNSSNNSTTTTQSNVKTKPENVDASEIEVLGIVEKRKRKAASNSAEHISQRSEGNAQQNVMSDGSSGLRLIEETKKKRVSEESVRNLRETHQETSNVQPRIDDGTPLWKQYLRGSANVDERQIPRYNSTRDKEERMATYSSTPAKLTNRIHVNGPCLYPMEENPKGCQKQELKAYFSQFGKIISVSGKTYKKSTVTFENCDSVARCLLKRNHQIGGHEFVIWETTPSRSVRKKLVANQEENWSSESASVPNNQIQLPPELTNRIFVTGPLLRPQELDPKAFQKEEFRRYFGQFGKIIVVCYSLPKLEGKVAFENWLSAMICIEQGTHTICGQDFVVRPETPTPSMQDKIRAHLSQNMHGPSSENVTEDTNRAPGL
ncbi:hypothetical protein DdX_15344 [Ditylenchus destructor]|uniref:RRM domain-containing protein n=1 Tax=Ditylenchus destructor TaxID=166010 RepID=A0AAD4MVG7_9BILA|nr:hypothetical protein DdX_15344 [Ditylenchus destructor]